VKLTLSLSPTAAERLESLAWEGETASQTVARLVHDRYRRGRNQRRAIGPRDVYRAVTGRWPEESE